MFRIHCLNLAFLGVSGVIGSYLIEAGEELVLIETGPASTFPALREEVERLGFSLEEIDKVFLTHIHLDHGGAAWLMAQLGAKIYAHPAGAPHLVDPSKLAASARRIYGDQMETLWGELRAIPSEQVIPLQDGERVRIGNQYEIIAVDTQGHAKHHHSYFLEGYLFTGDSAGIRIGDGPILPATPPPDVHIPTWQERIQRLKQLPLSYLCLSHFGIFDDPMDHLDVLSEQLEAWADLVKRLLQSYPVEEVVKRFEEQMESFLLSQGLTEPSLTQYRLADPFWMNAQGLIRYWQKYGG